MWMIVLLLLPLLGMLYIGWHVWLLVPLSPWWRAALLLVGLLSFLMLFLNLGRFVDRMPMWLARMVYDVGNSSLFVLLYLAILFLLLDLGRLFRLVRQEWLHQNLVVTAAIVLGMFAVFLYGNIHYYNKVRVTLPLKTDVPLAAPVRLVMLSDLHLGYHNPRKELARWVDMINDEHPDVVLIAGDIVDMSMRPLMEENMAEEMRRIHAPVYACLGNHEYYSRDPRVRQFFADAGIRLLCDSSAVEGNLLIMGRDDRTNVRRKPLTQLVKEAKAQAPAGKPLYTILLDHQPYELAQTEQAGINFQFSGHTHHGQVWPISWITDRVYECSFGPYQRGNTHYYVSSGMGIWGGKFRIGTRSEYVVATLTAEDGK